MAGRKTTEPDTQNETPTPETPSGNEGPDTSNQLSPEEVLKIQEENAALRKQLEAAEQKLATKDEPKVTTVDNSDVPEVKMVKVRLFKDSTNYVDDVFVAVNGETYQIQRGIEVEVPDYVKAVLDLSEKQDNETARRIEAAAKKAALKNEELNN